MSGGLFTSLAAKLKFSERTIDLGDRQVTITAPTTWDDTACRIAYTKYMWKGSEDLAPETSVEVMFRRVTGKIVQMIKQRWGLSIDQERIDDIYNELLSMQLLQVAAFNSPVYFNFGTPRKQVAAACFILDVKDDMRSIMKAASDMSMIFKTGSGIGINASSLRSSYEELSGKGKPSGPVSFMRIWDVTGAVIKSGGVTRRAAEIVVLNDDHPDILEFIDCKKKEEYKQLLFSKAVSMLKNGEIDIDPKAKAELNNIKDWFSMDGEITGGASFQNMNISVAATDDFMGMTQIKNGKYFTKKITTKEPVTELIADEVLTRIAEAAWVCGDPGIIFIDAVNDMHTYPSYGPIQSPNPCGEIFDIPSTACNLASINLLKIYDLTYENPSFNKMLLHTVRLLHTAQDSIVDFSEYPTEEIAQTTKQVRSLGIGITNAGALLIRCGISYDSDNGRELLASIMGAITAEAYKASAEAASMFGACPTFKDNAKEFQLVIDKHRQAYSNLFPRQAYSNLFPRLPPRFNGMRGKAIDTFNSFGATTSPIPVANSKVTAIAPTGTIGLLLGCDSTGVEPLFSLGTYKKLAGGGYLTQSPKVVGEYLATLPTDRLKRESLRPNKVLAVAVDFVPEGMDIQPSVLSPDAHIRMVATLTPFVSGGISKTINMPNSATVEDIKKMYVTAWKTGCKSISVYRDGSKVTQALYTQKEKKEIKVVSPKAAGIKLATRHRLGREVVSRAVHFTIGGAKGVFHFGEYEDGSLGEVYIRMYSDGTTVSGLLDSFAILFSWTLQHGAVSIDLLRRLRGVTFFPNGVTDCPESRIASSVVDFLMQIVETRYFKQEEKAQVVQKAKPMTSAGRICTACGGLMIPTGACWTCSSCGMSGGCG